MTSQHNSEEEEVIEVEEEEEYSHDLIPSSQPQQHSPMTNNLEEEYIEEEEIEMIPEDDDKENRPPNQQMKTPVRPPPLDDTGAPARPMKKRTLSLKQAPSKKEQQEVKRQKRQAEAESKSKFTTAQTVSHWIAQWCKNNLTPTEINQVLGKSSLNILVQDERIITSFTSLPQKTGGIIADLVKLSDPHNTSVLKLHVFSAFMSTLLPAMIVQHLNKFSPNVIKSWQCASLIHWDLILSNKRTVTLEIPKGEVIYFTYKAQHEAQFADEWISALLHPMKCYTKMATVMNNSLISVQTNTMCLELNRMQFPIKEDSPLQQDVRNLSERTKILCFNYVKQKLLTKEKLREYYAVHLKGLQYSSTDTLASDLKQHYQSPKHWYFRNQQNRDSSEPRRTTSNKTLEPTTSAHDMME